MNTEIVIGTEKFDIFSSADRKSLINRLQNLLKAFKVQEIETQSRLGKQFVEKVKLRTREILCYVKETFLNLLSEMSKQVPKKLWKELDSFLLKIEKIEQKLSTV
jgi:hypothetical protein